MSERELERLDAAARQYRVQIYETYRLDRNEFDRRKAAGDAVQVRWRAAGAHKEDLSAVLKWLEQATYLSQPQVRKAVPSLPEFRATGVGKSEQSSKRHEQANATERLATTESRLLPPSTAPAPSARANGQPYVQLRPGPAITAQPRVGRALLPPPWEVVSRAPWQSSTTIDTASIPRAENRQPPSPLRTDRPSRSPLPTNETASNAHGVAAALPVRPTRGFDAGRDSARKTAAPTTIGDPAENLSNAALPTSAPAATLPQGHRRDLIGKPSGAAKSPRVALARPNIARSAEELQSILATQSRPADIVHPTESQLNVGELLARASGYGFGLRTIDSVLHEQASLGPAELAVLLGELEALVDQRGDLMLYEQLVSSDVRERLVRSLDFPQTTVAALGSRIATARERLAQESGLAAHQREVGLQALANLSRRLSRLSQTTD